MLANALVMFVGPRGFSTRDLTEGRTYVARLPMFGEVDPDGLTVRYSDEIWLYDDVGDTVVTQLQYGFIVQRRYGDDEQYEVQE